MPVKNTSAFLRECIDSIVKQSYVDWELIAVDDHSTDSSFQILSTYATQDSRIRAITNEGQGIIEALKTGYALSTGTYITRMDSDDIMPSHKLEALLRQWHQKGKGYVVTGLVEYFSESELGDGYKKYGDWLNGLTKESSNFKDIYKECPIASPNWLMHRTDFEKSGAFDTEMYPEDYCLAFKWKQHGYKINGLHQITHQWRDYAHRTSRTDDNYSDNRFTKLKVTYFEKLDYEPQRTLVLWGAGSKGKAVAKELIANEMSFRWICDNDKKIGLDIYGVEMEGTDSLKDHNDPQVIIAVSQRDAKEGILEQLGSTQIEDYYFFC